MTLNRGLVSLLVAVAALAGAATANAKEIDVLYARVLREPANTELNLRFARLAEEQGVTRWALMAYERVVLNDPNNWEAKVGLMRVRRAMQPAFTQVTMELGTGYESNPLYYLPANQNPYTAPGSGSGKSTWFGTGLIALQDERKIGGQAWRSNAAVFGRANTRYGDLNYAHAGGETGPVFDVLPGLSFSPTLGAAVGYFDDRFYYAEGSGAATFEGQTREGIFHMLRARAAYRSYDSYWPSQEGWYYDIRARVAIPRLFGEGNLVAVSPWVLWSDISGTVTNAIVTEIQPGKYREIGGRAEIYQQLSAWMTVGLSFAASWRDYSGDFVAGTGVNREDTLLVPGAMVLFPGFFWKEWDLRFDYRYLHNDSNDPTKEYRDHIVTAAATKRFDPFRAEPTPGR
ncbi:hypothetical protein [Pseudorhodoplanes sp.]|uniref:hypothetical protein n=1 Tax=Pseudorhodoplanes sp. TaxID=1934341 RepID=UPI002C3A855A|nr:hypothetical protein [Pseudorhodoplanes sp.]HWV55022.1 hypothetical protein [Pseudorhodoplanes sp.]